MIPRPTSRLSGAPLTCRHVRRTVRSVATARFARGTAHNSKPALRFVVAIALVQMAVAGACVDAAAEGEGEGEGEELGDGLLEASPASCNLGSIEVGTEATCDVTLRNRGEGPLTIVSLLVDGAPSSSSLAITLLPGGVDSVVVPLDVTPAIAGEGEVLFTFVTDAASLEVPVRFFGVCSPTAVIRVLVDGDAAVAPFVADVSDDVVLDAGASVACPGRTIASAEWILAAVPASASTVLASPDALQTAIDAPSPGSLTIGLAVVDDLGARSLTDAVADVRYRPRLSFAVDDALLLGLEPHLFRGAGGNVERCTELDCFDGEGCGFFASAPPEWDAVAGRGPGDPLFDEAAGITVPVPVDGSYVAGVYVRGASASATATLAIDGVAPSTRTRSLDAGEFWTVARVTFLGGAPIVEAVDIVEALATCP